MYSVTTLPRSLLHGLIALRLGVWILSYSVFTAIIYSAGKLKLQTAAIFTFLCVAGIILSSITQYIILISHKIKSNNRLYAIATTVILVTIINSIVDTFTYGIGFAPKSGIDLKFIITNSLQSFAFLIWIHAFYAAIVWITLISYQILNQEKRLMKAEYESQKATVIALRSQINPHFLFNSLNAALALISANRNKEAEELISRLSDFFRTSLHDNKNSTHSLEEELEIIESYLHIEQIRFSDRLNVQIICPKELHNVILPAMLIQPLAENSIKHAVANSNEPVELTIEATALDDNVVISVEDKRLNILPINNVESNGIGLKNILDRLNVHYGDESSFRFHHTKTGFRAEIKIPMERIY